MKQISTLTLLLFFICSIFTYSQVDTLVIKLKNGSEERIAISDLKKITFESLNSVDENGNILGNIAKIINYPNPFSLSTRIEFEIDHPGDVEIKIYNCPGVLIKTYKCENCPAGRNTFVWDCRDESGIERSPGTYFLELRFNGLIQFKKMIMIN